MKITKTHLAKLIKEELDTVVAENAMRVLNEAAERETVQAVEVGKELINTPVGELAFKALDQSKEFQQAIQQMAAQVNEHNEQMNEQGVEQGYGINAPSNSERHPEGGATAGFALMGGVAGLAKAGTSMSLAFWSGIMTKSLGPIAFGILKTLGIGLGAAGGGMILAAVAGYLLTKGIMKVI